MQPTDLELLHLYQQEHNQEVLGTLYNRYIGQIYGACLKYLKQKEAAQDAVMDIYEELVVKCRKHQIEHWQAWLYMVSRNHCLQKLRKEKAAYLKINEAQRMYTEQVLHHTDEDLKHDELKQLEDCLDQLKADQQTCVRAFYLLKQSYKQIVVSTDYTWSQVRSHIQNGRRNLAICLGQ